MLAEEQIEYFRTFGLLVLVGALHGVTLGALIEKVDAKSCSLQRGGGTSTSGRKCRR